MITKNWLCPSCDERTDYVYRQQFSGGFEAYECPKCAIGAAGSEWRSHNTDQPQEAQPQIMEYAPADLRWPEIDTDEPIEQAYGLANLSPGKKALGGTSTRLSVYLMPEQLEQLERATAGMTAYERSKQLAKWILAGMEVS